MRAAFLTALVAAVSQARVHWSELQSYTFEKFASDYKLNLHQNSEEYVVRRQTFEQELARVIKHNAANATWKENINHMSAMTAAEKRVYHGRNKLQPKEKLSTEIEKNFTNVPESDLPVNVDWRGAGVVSAVKDQGGCGSCWAFASTATIESHGAIASGDLFDLSTQQMAACAPNPDDCGGFGNCQGSTAWLAFDYVANSKGMVEEYQYPYTEYYGVESSCNVPKLTIPKVKLSGFVRLGENNYLDLLNAVATVGPIAISVDASNWHAYDVGIFDGCNQSNPDIDHVVVLVGYGEENGQKYWLVRNSWSASWGEKGYIRIKRDSNDESNCGVDTTPQDGSGCTGGPATVIACGTCGILYDSAYPVIATTNSFDSFLH